MYSRELRKILYFETYGYGDIVKNWRGYYFRYWGINLSSFSLIEVLMDRGVRNNLKEMGKGKYVLVGRSVNNNRVILDDEDLNRIVWILDESSLHNLTGKRGTIPERVRMRLRTMKGGSTVYSRSFDGFGYYCFLVLYGERGMKMFVFGKDSRWREFRDGLSRVSDVFVFPRGRSIAFAVVTSLSYLDLKRFYSSVSSDLSRH